MKLVDVEKVKALIKKAHDDASATFDRSTDDLVKQHECNGGMTVLVLLSAEIEKMPADGVQKVD